MQLDEGPRDDLNDLQLDPGAPPAPEPDLDPGGDDEGPNWPLIWVVILLLVAVVGVYFGYFRGRKQAQESPPPPVVEAPAEPAEDAESAGSQEPEIELPTLDASDEMVRQLVGGLADHPRLARWLAPEELVRKFVAAVDNIAAGQSPRRHLGALDPQADFESSENGGLAVIDPESFGRYDDLASMFSSIEPADAAELYRTLEPLFDEAYRDLGYPDRDFDTVVARAIDELVSTPVPSAEVALLPRVSSYEFADPSLEKLSPAQKHLVRMGPANVRRVQRQLIAIRDEIGLEP